MAHSGRIALLVAVLVIVKATRHFPKLELVVRANGMEHRMRLINAGVKYVFHEMTGNALDAGVRATLWMRSWASAV